MEDAATAGGLAELYPTELSMPPRRSDGRPLTPVLVATDWMKSVRKRGLKVSDRACCLLITIVQHFGTKTHLGYPGRSLMASTMGKTERTVQRALRELIEHPEAPIRQVLRGQHRTPAYTFTLAAYRCSRDGFRGDKPDNRGDSAGPPGETAGDSRGDKFAPRIKEATPFQDSAKETPGEKALETQTSPPPVDLEQAIERCLVYRYEHAEITPTAIERRSDGELVRTRLAEGISERDLKAAVRGVMRNGWAIRNLKTRSVFWTWGDHHRTLELAREAPAPPPWETAGVTKDAWMAEEQRQAAEDEAKRVAEALRIDAAWAERRAEAERERAEKASQEKAAAEAREASARAQAAAAQARGLADASSVLRRELAKLGVPIPGGR